MRKNDFATDIGGINLVWDVQVVSKVLGDRGVVGQVLGEVVGKVLGAKSLDIWVVSDDPFDSLSNLPKAGPTGRAPCLIASQELGRRNNCRCELGKSRCEVEL